MKEPVEWRLLRRRWQVTAFEMALFEKHLSRKQYRLRERPASTYRRISTDLAAKKMDVRISVE